MIPMIHRRQVLILIGLSFVFFFLGNNLISLTDPDEVFYSLTAKEMLVRHEWLTPYIFGFPQFEKPILTFWTLLTAFHVGGINPWTARFPAAFFATLAVIGIYVLGVLLFRDQRRAFLAGLVLASSAFFVAMGKTVFTDMIFTTFILYSILGFYLAYAIPVQRPLGLILCGLCGGLAVLTKGPLGLIIPLLVGVVFLLYRRKLHILATPWSIVGLSIAFAIALPWYLYMYQTYGNAFVHEFFYNDHWRRVIEAEHRSNDRWYFYPISMVAGMFPFSLFLLSGFKDLFKRFSNHVEESDHLIMAWILVVFVVFQCAHSKLVSYILPLFPALALLTADVIARRISPKILVVKAAFLALLAGVIMVLPYFIKHKFSIPQDLVFWISGSLFVLAGVVYSCAISSREKIGLYVLSSVVMVVLIGGWFAKDVIEHEASCAPVSQYLPGQLPQGQRILTSKPFARGIVFYTGLPVTVFDPGGRGYFSPHPIPNLTDDQQLVNFLKSQPVTYAYLKKSAYEHVLKNMSDRFNVSLVQSFGRQRLVKIEPLVRFN